MRILTNGIHTGLDSAMASAIKDSEWYSNEFDHAWDTTLRPVPHNWHRLGEGRGLTPHDVILAQSMHGAEMMKDERGPMIFNQPNDASEGEIPEWLEERCYAVNFISPEVADRWKMRDDSKKRVIAMPIDGGRLGEYVGDGMGNDILTVGHRISQRWDKGHCALRTFDEVMLRCDLLGPGNEDMRVGRGALPGSALRVAYQHYKVYFNPGPIIGISVAEAMLTGMPVVTFRPINHRDLIRDGETGFVTDTLDGAYLKIKRLLGDPSLCRRIGAAGREAARKLFDPALRGWEWEQLFREAVATYNPRRVAV